MSMYVVTDPATGEVLEEFPEATIEEIQQAVHDAYEASRTWGRTSTVEERTGTLALLQKVAALGAAGPGASRRLATLLARPPLRELWSVAMADFDPARQRFRELAFSYQ